MNRTTRTTRPALYRKPVPIFWWLHRRAYLVFVLRELSSVFIAWFVVFLLLMVGAVADGGDAYERFQDWSANGWVTGLNAIALLFVLLHTVTWFGLAPRAMVVRLRGRRVRPRSIVGLHYVLWALLTAAVTWLVLSG
ncbi:hypothetical protein [Streptomyces spiramyceticus]|uniref:hypothetical protein n=1 Tax=Streptomyces spiramyceticus TaxID=299717 RepID=UPI00237A9AF2|nr:hypothetical protein [Streptomyces spiramyceticus]